MATKKNITYINNRIIGNTGSIYTKTRHIHGNYHQGSDRVVMNYKNSLNENNRYGFEEQPVDSNVDKVYDFNNISTKIPFEMELVFSETYNDHLQPRDANNQYSVPFSPLNTEFFRYGIEAATLVSNGKTLDEYDVNNSYYQKYIEKYPYILAGLMFASSMPINSDQFHKYAETEFKLPGFKQIPFSLAIWLGSKWHYYKHQNEIVYKQYDIDSLTNPIFIFNDKVNNIVQQSSTKFHIEEIGSNFQLPYKIFRPNAPVFEIEGEQWSMQLNELTESYSINQIGLEKNPYVNSCELPKNTIGLDLPLIKTTLKELEPNISLNNISDTVLSNIGLYNQIKHYEFGQSTLYDIDSQYEHKILHFCSYQIDINGKLDIISGYQNQTYPGIHPLSNYPKGTNSRTVETNTVYSTTFATSTDDSSISRLQQEYNRESVFNALSTGKSYDVYAALKNYIRYNTIIQASTGNDIIPKIVKFIDTESQYNVITRHKALQGLLKTEAISNESLFDVVSILYTIFTYNEKMISRSDAEFRLSLNQDFRPYIPQFESDLELLTKAEEAFGTTINDLFTEITKHKSAYKYYDFVGKGTYENLVTDIAKFTSVLDGEMKQSRILLDFQNYYTNPKQSTNDFTGKITNQRHYTNALTLFEQTINIVIRMIDKIITEEVNNQLSIDYHIQNISNNRFVSRLYPSAGGTINLAYGMNTHLYMDVIDPINRLLNNKPIIKTVVDPRLVSNRVDNTDVNKMLGDNLRNIQNSSLRYIWYSGPYFGAPIAQLRPENIIFADNGVVSNLMDISNIPLTNYSFNLDELGHLSYENEDNYPFYIANENVDNNQVYYGDMEQIGSIPNGINNVVSLNFNNIIKNVGYDILDQLENIFLIFCGNIPYDDDTLLMKDIIQLLMRVDETDLTALPYIADYTKNKDYVTTSNGNGEVTSDGLGQLSINDQVNILNIGRIEADTDYYEYLTSTKVYNDSSEENDSDRVTISYLTNIILTNGQYNKANKILNQLNNQVNDIYIKRNWTHNTTENNLVKFILIPENISKLNSLSSTYTTNDLTNVTELYREYLYSLFNNYEPGKLVSMNVRNVVGESYLNNRATEFIRQLIYLYDNKTKAPKQFKLEHIYSYYLNDMNGTIQEFTDNLQYRYMIGSETDKLNIRSDVNKKSLFKFLNYFNSRLIRAILETLHSDQKLYTEIQNLTTDVYMELVDFVIKSFTIMDNTNDDQSYVYALLDEVEDLILTTIKNNLNESLNTVKTEIFATAHKLLFNMNTVLKQYTNDYMYSFMKVLKTAESTDEVIEKRKQQKVKITDILSNDLRVKPYYNTKKLFDTWLYNLEEQGGLFNTIYSQKIICDDNGIKPVKSDGVSLATTFHYLDRGNNDISDKLYIDIDWLYKYFIDPESTSDKLYYNNTALEASLYTFFGDIAKQHGFVFHALPSFSDLGTNNTESMEKMFQTYDYLEHKSTGPHFIFQYIGDVTSKLDTNTNEFNYRKSFCLLDEENIPGDIIANNDNKVTGFVVQFGEQNQQIFNNIQLDQAEFKNTEEYFEVITNLTKNSVGSSVGPSLYRIYDERSYTATITSMGNIEIEPLMYFYLKNVPLFKGSYWITNVSHSITPNNMVTTFKGVRQPMSILDTTEDLILRLGKQLINNTTNATVNDKGVTIYQNRVKGLYDTNRLKGNQGKLELLNTNDWDSVDVINANGDVVGTESISILTDVKLKELLVRSPSPLTRQILTSLDDKGYIDG